MSLAADVYPIQRHGNGGPIEYMCISMGGVAGCLSYMLPGTQSAFSITYEKPNGPSTPSDYFCELSAWPEFARWSRVELKLTRAGVFSFTLNGVTTECATNSNINSGTTSVRIGAAGKVGQLQLGDIHYDNVVTFVERQTE